MVELIPLPENKENFRKDEFFIVHISGWGNRLIRNLDEQMHSGSFINIAHLYVYVFKVCSHSLPQISLKICPYMGQPGQVLVSISQ